MLAFIYPFMKRYTHLPQLFLGAAFSWAIPMAWAAEAGELSQLTWLLFTANVLWTVAYDTFYAMVDRDDDLKVGIKSTAVLFGDADRAIIAILQTLVVLILVLVGRQAELGSLYYQVPGWPLGFGDDDKARGYLQKALAINPDGIDANYFFGDYLIDQGEPERARAYLQKVMMAPGRPGREVADIGRKREAEGLLSNL